MTTLTTLSIILIINLFYNPVNQNTNLSITVNGFDSNEGKATAVVFKSKKGFPLNHDKAFRKYSTIIDDHTCRFMINDLPEEAYAVLVYHDQNNNNKLDKNLIGMPKEGIALSNYKKISGRPNYDKAKFRLTNKEQQVITLKYL